MFERNSRFMRSTSSSRRMSRRTKTVPAGSSPGPLTVPAETATGTRSPSGRSIMVVSVHGARDARVTRRDRSRPCRSTSDITSCMTWPVTSDDGTPVNSSAARLKIVIRPAASTARSPSLMLATTVSRRLRRATSSSIDWRRSVASDSMDVAIESNAALSTPTSS